MELMGQGSVGRFREVLGPTDSSEAQKIAPISIRAKFGTGNLCNKYFHAYNSDNKKFYLIHSPK